MVPEELSRLFCAMTRTTTRGPTWVRVRADLFGKMTALLKALYSTLATLCVGVGGGDISKCYGEGGRREGGEGEGRRRGGEGRGRARKEGGGKGRGGKEGGGKEGRGREEEGRGGEGGGEGRGGRREGGRRGGEGRGGGEVREGEGERRRGSSTLLAIQSLP